MNCDIIVAGVGGSSRATNMVMIGAASTLLPIDAELLETQIREAFAHRGARLVDGKLRAFRAGREATVCAAA